MKTGNQRLCPGCRSLGGIHDFGSTCTLAEEEAPLPSEEELKNDPAVMEYLELMDILDPDEKEEVLA